MRSKSESATGHEHWWIQDVTAASETTGHRRTFMARKLHELLGSLAGGRNADLNLPESLPRPIEPECDPDHYYLLNNYNPRIFR